MSPRSPARNEELRAETRARIARHALALFARHGYDGTTIRMIAEDAGISQGLIYQHFAGKDVLLRELFEQSMKDVEASFAMADAAVSPDERIAQLIHGAFRIIRGNLDFWKLSYGVRMQAAALAQLGDRLPQWTAMILRTLERHLREAGIPKPRVEAAILFALIDGVSQHFVLSPDDYPLDAVAKRVIELYGGLAATARRAPPSPSGRRSAPPPSRPARPRPRKG